jgi:hypothetical protein
MALRTPAVLAGPAMLAHHLHEPHPVWHPLWEWLGQPALAIFVAAGTVSALLGPAMSVAQSGAGAPATRKVG